MNVNRSPFGDVSERGTRVPTDPPMRESELPVSQIRTCTHCGRQATFRLQDSAGWYACSECGRYA